MLPASDDPILSVFMKPEFYPHPVAGVEYLQTHISHIFLTGSHAYKVKKPVDLGFLDFSSLEARRRFCLEELRLNRRLCPELYLEVLAVARGPEGLTLAPLEQAGDDALEFCLKMAQMDSGRMMDRLLDQGEVGPAQVRELAKVLADFFARAEGGPTVDFHGRPEQVRINVEENFRQTESYQEVSVSTARWRAIRDYSLSFLARERPLLERRVAEGRIRDGHGDLHSGNINLPAGGRPLIFDCIEFNERFRYQDAAADLAFLAMDLDFHGREDLAKVLVEAYIKASGDAELGALMDFYKCYRAVVRAKVFGFMFDDDGVHGREKFTDITKARAYFRLAARYAGGEPPYFMVCMMGLMGTGKTYLARKLAGATGWVAVHSDALRKQLAGMATQQRSYDAWGRGLYGPDVTEATYQALYEGAEARLAQGASVVVDASFREEARRRLFLELARRHGARALFVEVRASAEVVAERLAARQAKGGSMSDGRSELTAVQAAAWEDAGPLLTEHGMIVDGGAKLPEKLDPILERLKAMGRREDRHE